QLVTETVQPLLAAWHSLIGICGGPGEGGCGKGLEAHITKGERSVARYCVGGIPTYRLNTLLKLGIDPKPAAYTTSLMRSDGSTSNVLAFSTRTRATYSVSVMPVAFLKSLQK